MQFCIKTELNFRYFSDLAPDSQLTTVTPIAPAHCSSQSASSISGTSKIDEYPRSRCDWAFDKNSGIHSGYKDPATSTCFPVSCACLSTFSVFFAGDGSSLCAAIRGMWSGIASLSISPMATHCLSATRLANARISLVSTG